MIQFYNDGKEHVIQLNEMSYFSGIEKRRLYDYMNSLSALNVSQKIATHKYLWKGMSQIKPQLIQLGMEIELKSFDSADYNIFQLPESPNIKVLTSHLMQYCLYYGCDTFMLREVAMLFSNSPENTKSMIRRLYLVAFFLERLGIIKHLCKTGEYHFCYNAVDIMTSVYNELKANHELPDYSIIYQVNRITEQLIQKKFADRRSQVHNFIMMKDAGDTLSNHNDFSDVVNLEYQNAVYA